MSSLVRFKLLNNVSKKIIPLSSQSQQVRLISTSKKNRDTATITTETETECRPKLSDPRKNWMSYGFSHEDYDEDRLHMHATFFFGVTLCMVFGGFVYAYKPDDLARDWALREAFLEVRRREEEGLPLVDADYIPVDKIILPTDEELGDTEIII